MVVEQAKKELEKLETQYPNSFESLKLDLKTFISQLEVEEEEKLSSQQYYSFPTTTASSHVSSTRKKKRKKGNTDVKDDQAQSKLEISNVLYMKRSCCENGHGYGKRRDTMSTDAAIERARVCLEKVQQFKTSFFQY